MQYERKTLIEALEWEQEQRNNQYERDAQEHEAKADELRKTGHHFTHHELRNAFSNLLQLMEQSPGRIVYSEELDKIFFENSTYHSHKAVSEREIEIHEEMAEKKRRYISTEDSSVLTFLKSISHTKVSQSALDKAGFSIKAGRLIGDYLRKEAAE